MSGKKLFAQQQTAKRATRKYHGQGLPERIFKKQLYSPRFNVVAGATEDGERLIWGGLYQGVERRLDTVLFRSLFASSIQQARQMVIHGHVEVNGKKVSLRKRLIDLGQEHRPGLLLRPGDIYHTDPQLVKRFISSHFHAKHIPLNTDRRHQMTARRSLYLKKQGKNLESVLPVRPAHSHRFEYSPYTPIEVQGTHPIFRLLDDQARAEEREFQRYEKFNPKPFMAPMVWLPAYLEVSYRSCTGCFVRFPQIKKDGLMEIPSPYPENVHMRAGMFYTRYGRGVWRRQRGYRGYRLYWSKNKQRR